MKSKRSWNEKLHDAKEPQVKKLDKAFADMPEGCMMLIATPEIPGSEDVRLYSSLAMEMKLIVDPK